MLASVLALGILDVNAAAPVIHSLMQIKPMLPFSHPVCKGSLQMGGREQVAIFIRTEW